jgi:hypothetical protein
MAIAVNADCLLIFGDVATADRFDRLCIENEHLFQGGLPRLWRLPDDITSRRRPFLSVNDGKQTCGQSRAQDW